MSTSFINEHSAEFVLVPQFASILSTEYKSVVPIYFWAGREGSKISLECAQRGKLRVVAMYAPRPKIDVPKQEIIEVKFNDILYRRAEYFHREGIPVFAGVPNVSSLKDFQVGSDCSWFYLRGDGLGREEITLLNTLNGRLEGSSLLEPLSTKDILNYIRVFSTPLEWERAVEIIRSVGKSDGNHSYSYWRFATDTYKPVYFLLWY